MVTLTGSLIFDGLIAAFIAFFVTALFRFLCGVLFLEPPRLYYAEKEKADGLEHSLQPRLVCTFDKSDPGCIRAGTQITNRASTQPVVCTYYRLKVEAFGQSVMDCMGRIIKIERNGITVMAGENLTIPFAPGNRPEAIKKRIDPGVPEYLDLLAITDDNKVFIPTYEFVYPSSVSLEEIFNDPSDYELEVVITSPRASSIRLRTLFKWTGTASNASVGVYTP